MSTVLEDIEGIIERDTDECVRWPRPYTTRRPKAWFKGVRRAAANVICRLAHGDPPPGKHDAAHRCGHEWCVNWKHLRWATSKENNADKVDHGTDPSGERNGRTDLTEADVLDIRRRYRHGQAKAPRSTWGDVNRGLREQYHLSETALRLIAKGKTWRHL